MKNETTDPIIEFYDLAVRLQKKDPGGSRKMSDVIEGFLHGPEMTCAVFQWYGAVNKRADGLCYFVNNINDNSVDDDIKIDTITSIRKIQKVFHYDRMAHQYTSVISSNIKPEYLKSLYHFSRTARKHRILRHVNEENLAKLSEKIDDAVNEILKTQEMPEWARQLLLEGVKDLRFRVQNFWLFGHDEIISAAAYLQTIERSVLIEIEQNTSYRPKLIAFAAVIILVKDIITAPVELTQAISSYHSWFRHIPSSKQLLLAPPAKEPKNSTNRNRKRTTNSQNKME